MKYTSTCPFWSIFLNSSRVVHLFNQHSCYPCDLESAAWEVGRAARSSPGNSWRNLAGIFRVMLGKFHHDRTRRDRALQKPWCMLGKSNPNGRTIQAGEILKFTQVCWNQVGLVGTSFLFRRKPMVVFLTTKNPRKSGSCKILPFQPIQGWKLWEAIQYV